MSTEYKVFIAFMTVAMLFSARECIQATMRQSRF